jgi:hypothetical protein
MPIFGGIESLYFCLLGAHAKLQNPYDKPFPEKITAGEERKKKNTKNSKLPSLQPKLLRW